MRTAAAVEESRLQDGLEFQGVNLCKNGLEPLFQLLLRPRFSFRCCKLCVIGNRAPVEIGSFVEQFGLGIILSGHSSILPELRPPGSGAGVRRTFAFCRVILGPLQQGLALELLKTGLRQLLQFVQASLVYGSEVETRLPLHKLLQGGGNSL